MAPRRPGVEKGAGHEPNARYRYTGLMDLHELRIEAVDDEMVAVLRNMTGAQRLRIANSIFLFAQCMIRYHLRVKQPNWNEDQIDRETARCISRGTVELD